MFDYECLSKLVRHYRNDNEALEFIKSALDSFEEYHAAVMKDQLFPFVYGGVIVGSEYREKRAALDKARSIHHNSVIANVNLLNRMAQAAGLPAIYNGVVSEERPYRRQIADAVFEFIAFVIEHRS